ncbi:hypothetical protein NPIL_55701 [Nephila pilipes]|uniref:Uncharacterized protein n=1 Tax=Nephila pilipes TaxID=299642 RepID=A0A8X6QN19_NEPPI|nr:hypothetical protein NPIL_55701 [Nephila pilipes]
MPARKPQERCDEETVLFGGRKFYRFSVKQDQTLPGMGDNYGINSPEFKVRYFRRLFILGESARAAPLAGINHSPRRGWEADKNIFIFLSRGRLFWRISLRLENC